ncbi:uncharacterized protein V1518DRAFT_412752 [Limtongia smithiae]|uniref:uncharacterized protein n=1 Tax=Limtongia smithiae TaxID=1125753 RepID=UPI0034CFA6CE
MTTANHFAIVLSSFHLSSLSHLHPVFLSRMETTSPASTSPAVSSPADAVSPTTPSTTPNEPAKHLLLRRYTPADRVGALVLVGETTSERRSLANRYLFRHPMFLVSLVPLFAFVFKRFDLVQDLGTVVLLMMGFVMAVMSLFSRLTEELREKTNEVVKGKFLEEADYGFVALYGNKIIGVVTMKYVEIKDKEDIDPLTHASTNASSTATARPSITARAVPGSPSTAASKKSTAAAADKLGIVTSWAVVKRYRHVGLGADLLSYVLRAAAQDKCSSVLVQILSLEAAARSSLVEIGFDVLSVTKLAGALGKLGVALETYAIAPLEWAKKSNTKL